MPKPVVQCPWKRDARERRLAELRALEAGASAEELVLYSDELPGGVRLAPRHGRRSDSPSGGLMLFEDRGR